MENSRMFFLLSLPLTIFSILLVFAKSRANFISASESPLENFKSIISNKISFIALAPELIIPKGVFSSCEIEPANSASKDSFSCS